MQKIFFAVFKSLRSSVSEGILAVDERMSKQEDIRKKKVCSGVYPETLVQSSALSCHCEACGPLSPGICWQEHKDINLCDAGKGSAWPSHAWSGTKTKKER